MGYCSSLVVMVTVNCIGCFWQNKFIALVVTLMLTGTLGYSKGLNCVLCMQHRHKPLLLSMWPGVLFLVQFNNFDWVTRSYSSRRSYALVHHLPAPTIYAIYSITALVSLPTSHWQKPCDVLDAISLPLYSSYKACIIMLGRSLFLWRRLCSENSIVILVALSCFSHHLGCSCRLK